MQDCYMNDIDILDDIEYNKDGADFGLPTKDPLITVVDNNYVIAPAKKYIRTVMLDPETGEYVAARITMATGEIKPFKYKTEAKADRPKPPQEFLDKQAAIDYGADGDLLDYTPHWVTIPAPNRCLATHKGVDALPPMRKSKPNPNKIYLEAFENMSEAIGCFPWLDDLIVGVSKLDCGNTRPFKTGLLFGMLRDCEEINVETIFAYTGHSEKHCWRLAQYMRVLVAAFDKEVER